MTFAGSSKRSDVRRICVHVLSHIGNLMQFHSPYVSETARVSWRTSENLKDTKVDPYYSLGPKHHAAIMDEVPSV